MSTASRGRRKGHLLAGDERHSFAGLHRRRRRCALFAAARTQVLYLIAEAVVHQWHSPVLRDFAECDRLKVVYVIRRRLKFRSHIESNSPLYKPSIIKVRLYPFNFNTIAFGRYPIFKIIQLHCLLIYNFLVSIYYIHFIKLYFVRISNLVYIMKRLKLNILLLDRKMGNDSLIFFPTL